MGGLWRIPYVLLLLPAGSRGLDCPTWPLSVTAHGLSEVWGSQFPAPRLMRIHFSSRRAILQRRALGARESRHCSCMSPAPQHRWEAPHLIGRDSIARTESDGCRSCCLSAKQTKRPQDVPGGIRGREEGLMALRCA